MECRLLFHDKNLEQFDWCKLDESTGKVTGSGVSTAEELTSICAEISKISVFLPQQNILLTSPQLPPKANKQQLNAIAYSVEELLAQDIEDCFFAIAAQQDDHTIPVAVIEREIMQECTQLLSRHHVNASQILPQIYLCPWVDEDDLLACICQFQGGYLIRYGKHAGLLCDEPMLKQIVGLLFSYKSSTQNRLEIYADELLPDIEQEGLLINRQASCELLARPFDALSCINLKQKEYRSTYQWLELLRHWQWPMVAMVLLAVLFVTSNLLDDWKKQQTLNDLLYQQQSLLSRHLTELPPGNSPKKQLIKALADSRDSEGQVGFLDLLHEYSILITGFNTVDINKIQYHQSELLIDLQTTDLKSLESFTAKLEKSRFPALIEKVNISPDKTTGRLVMRDQ